jgi:hypothetical protein
MEIATGPRTELPGGVPGILTGMNCARLPVRSPTDTALALALSDSRPGPGRRGPIEVALRRFSPRFEPSAGEDPAPAEAPSHQAPRLCSASLGDSAPRDQPEKGDEAGPWRWQGILALGRAIGLGRAVVGHDCWGGANHGARALGSPGPA